MAVRTWTGPLLVAAGAGLLVSVGQLGIGDGLGILRWDRGSIAPGPWHAQLTWIAFLTTSAVIVAALAGDWRTVRQRQRPDLSRRIGTVLAGAVGAAVAVPLAARSAGQLRLTETGDPGLTAGLTAGAGLLVGLVGAFAVLRIPAVRGNVISCLSWVWLATAISAVWTLSDGSTWAAARLGQLPPGGAWTPAALIGAPVLIALVVSAVARFGGGHPIAVSASGATGPLLVCLSYLVAGPEGQSSAYWSALIAIGAGAAVSVPVALVRRPSPGATPAIATTAGTEPATVDTASPLDGPDREQPVPAASQVPRQRPAPDLWSTPAPTTATSPTAPTTSPIPTTSPSPGNPASLASPMTGTEPATTSGAEPAAEPAPEPAPESRRGFARWGRRKSGRRADPPSGATDPALTKASPAGAGTAGFSVAGGGTVRSGEPPVPGPRSATTPTDPRRPTEVPSGQFTPSGQFPPTSPPATSSAAASPTAPSPAGTTPAATKPTAAKPAAAKPTTAKPAAAKPAAAKPAAAKPAAAKPAAAKPTAAKPTTVKPPAPSDPTAADRARATRDTAPPEAATPTPTAATPASATQAGTTPTGAGKSGAGSTGPASPRSGASQSAPSGTGSGPAGARTPARDTPARDAARDSSAKDAPAKGASGRDAPIRDAPTRDAPAKGEEPRDAAPKQRGRRPFRRKTEEQPPSDLDADYVDWVKGLGAEPPAVRIGGARPRHSRDGDTSGGTSA